MGGQQGKGQSLLLILRRVGCGGKGRYLLSFRISKSNNKLQRQRRIPMYEEIFELINKGEINKAQEQIEKISDDDPKNTT